MSQADVRAQWNEHVGWSVTADRLKRSIAISRTAVLVLTASGALLQTLAASFGGNTRIAAAGAACLTVAPFVTANFLSREHTSCWQRARSISEAIKTEVFQFLAQVDKYASLTDPAAALRTKCKEIREWGMGLELARAKTGEIKMAAPSFTKPEDYLNLRIDEQINSYYRPKSVWNATRAEQYRLIELALGLAAAVMGGIVTAVGSDSKIVLGPWVAVVTTVTGAITAHAAASRYDFQATTFAATARQLTDLLAEWRALKTNASGAAWSEFVRQCEDVISAENRGWMAKLDE